MSQYFSRYQPETVPYGFLPELPDLLTVREEIDAEHATQVGGWGVVGWDVVHTDPFVHIHPPT